ncbi:MAG: pilus assembly protein TadG-related protein [Solirubrobacteraceae bacterium]
MLVLVALLMTAVLASAALAIDLGHFYQAQTQAQSAADAAALAAAQDLGGPSSTAAGSVGTTIALTNYPGANVTVAEPTTNEAKVTVNANSPSIFGKALGLTSAKVSATAVAGVAGLSTQCTNPGSSCYAFFAMDTSCSNVPLSFSGGGTQINGALWSNGSLSSSGSGSSFGPTFYGSNCTASTSGATFSSGPTPSTPNTAWPVDYSKDFPACGADGETECTGPCDVSTTPCPSANLTPSFCTQASNATGWALSTSSFTLQSGNIYCDVGTGQADNPSTWNGAVTVSSGSGTVEATYIAGSITFDSSGTTVKACGYSTSGYQASGCSPQVPTPVTANYPLAYLTGTGSVFTINGGNASLTGDVFAPNGTLNWNGGSDTMTGFYEAQDLSLNGGSVTGAGPTVGSWGTVFTGSVSLLQ